MLIFDASTIWDYLQNLDAVIGILGLLFGGAIYAFLYDKITLTRYRLMGTKSSLISSLEEIVANNSLYFSKPKKVGTYSPLEVETYIDLMTAVTDPDVLKQLEKILIRWIKMAQTKDVNKIAVPKRGNVILASAVARRMDLPLLVIREEDSIAQRRESPIEGALENGDCVLFIDDIVSDPELILKSINKITNKKGIVIDVVALIDREEWLSHPKILEASNKLRYFPLLSLEDKEIKLLIKKYKTKK